MWPWIHIGDLRIPTFLLVQSLNAILLLWWAKNRASRFGISPRQALDLTLVVLFGGLVGGRLFHVLWEAPDFYRENPAAVFALLNGGYVYFGGLLLGLLFGALSLKWNQQLDSIRTWLDFGAPLAAVGSSLGRVGCFLAGCCYGKTCALPWALPFWDERGLRLMRHPTQLYSAFWDLGIFLFLMALEKTPPRKRPSWLRPQGILFVAWLGLHGAGRFVIEFFRDDFRGPEYFLTVSQWLSICALIISCLVLRRFLSHPLEMSEQRPR